MSTQNPRPGPRRRIAGERRPSRTPAPDTSSSHPVDEPPSASAPTSSGSATDAPTEPIDATDTVDPTDTGTQADAGPGVESDRGTTTSAGPRRAPSWLLVGLIGGLAVVLVVTSALLGLVKWRYADVRREDRAASAARTAPATAERAAATVLSYDYRSIDKDVRAAERYLAPGLRAKYAKSMGLVKQNAPKLRARVVAQVRSSGVSHADADRVDVLVYVNQTTRSTANGGEAQVALNRTMFSMVRSKGTWLVSDIKSY